MVLRKQLDRVKTEKMAEMKMEGVDSTSPAEAITERVGDL